MSEPKISDKTELTLDEAKAEYKELVALLNQTEGFPQGGTGWSNSVLTRIYDRQTFLRTLITDFVCEVK